MKKLITFTFIMLFAVACQQESTEEVQPAVESTINETGE
jgi:PBP1b-binding outer membrane lipoprotein LpoB